MNLSYSLTDLKKYILLVDNHANATFKLKVKEIYDFEMAYNILHDQILTHIEAKKAKKALEVGTKNAYINPRDVANEYISKPHIRLAVFKKHGKVCLACGSKNEISLDHVVPVCRGGWNSVNNLQPLCRSCNSKKGKKIIDYR